MTPPPLQVTRFDRLLRQLSEWLFGGLRGSWRRRSLAWLALLIGFYLGQNVTSLWLIQVGKRPLAVLGLVLLMELEDAVLLQRLLARGRSDDNEAVIRNRLEVYQQQTAPLIAHYRERGLLASVDAAGSVEEISKRIATLLEN